MQKQTFSEDAFAGAPPTRVRSPCSPSALEEEGAGSEKALFILYGRSSLLSIREVTRCLIVPEKFNLCLQIQYSNIWRIPCSLEPFGILTITYLTTEFRTRSLFLICSCCEGRFPRMTIIWLSHFSVLSRRSEIREETGKWESQTTMTRP